MSLQRGINLRALAEKMGNCSGAEVRGICTEAGKSGNTSHSLPFAPALTLYHSLAGMYALRERRQHVTQEDFEMSVAKVRSALMLLASCRCSLYVDSTVISKQVADTALLCAGAAQDWGRIDVELEAVQLDSGGGRPSAYHDNETPFCITSGR